MPVTNSMLPSVLVLHHKQLAMTLSSEQSVWSTVYSTSGSGFIVHAIKTLSINLITGRSLKLNCTWINTHTLTLNSIESYRNFLKSTAAFIFIFSSIFKPPDDTPQFIIYVKNRNFTTANYWFIILFYNAIYMI